MSTKRRRRKVICVVCGRKYVGWAGKVFDTGQFWPSKHWPKNKDGDKNLCAGSFISTIPLEEKK